MMRQLVILCLSLVLVSSAAAADPQMRAHFIDVGQGAATLLEFPCGAILIDTGGQDDEHSVQLGNYLKAFFERRSDLNTTLNAVIISHPHIDHTRGIRTVLSACRVQTYIDNGIVAGSGKANVKFVRDHVDEHQALIREIQDDEIVALPQKTGLTDDDIDSIKCTDCDPKIRILSGGLTTNPGWDEGEFDNLNNHSIVVRVDFGESSFLFTGDLEAPALETLVDYYSDTDLLDVDVYLVGHHGSANGTTKSLLGAMSPDMAVIGVGKSTFGAGSRRGFTTFAYGHPRRSIVDMLSLAIASKRNRAIDIEVADSARHFSVDHITKRIYATGWDGNVAVTAKLDGTMRVRTGDTEDALISVVPPAQTGVSPAPALAALAEVAEVAGTPHTAASAPAPQRYRWNTAIPEKSPSAGGNGKIVLFDNSHCATAGQADWVIDGGFSTFADALVEAGYTVREYRGVDKNGDGMIRYYDDRTPSPNVNEAVIEFDAIKSASVFVMAETNRPLRVDEQNALINFVAQGKGLFFIADHYNADRNLNSWDATEVFNGYNRSTHSQFKYDASYGDLRNPGDPSKGWLAENFGVRFRFNAINCLKGASDIVAPAAAEQLTEGVTPVLMAASSTLAIIDPSKAKGLVYLKSTDPAQSWPNAVEGTSKGMYFGGRKEGPLVAVSKRGRGKAAFIGDSSPIEDNTAKYRNEMSGGRKSLHNGWSDPGNAAKLSINIVHWLSTTEDYTSFDGNSGHVPGEQTPDLMAVAERDDPDDGQPWGPRRPGYDPWNTDTYSPGSFGAPLPASSGGSSGGGLTSTAIVNVEAALQAPEGSRLTVEGLIQGELNDQFGLKLSDSPTSSGFLAVQLPTDLRITYSPKLAPDVIGKRVRISGKRSKYTGLPGFREIESIRPVGSN